MPLRKQKLDSLGDAPPEPAIVPLTGLQAFKRSPAIEALRAQDKVAALGRRTVCSTGLRGDSEWRVPNTDPHSVARTHPDNSTYYVVARSKFELTPGHFLRLTGACCPSGETQSTTTDGVGFYHATGPQGYLRATVVWTDRDGETETTQQEISLPVSNHEFAAENTDAGGSFLTSGNFDPVDLRPPGIDLDPTELARWSRLTTTEVTLEVRGSPRIVDASVVEVPVAWAGDTASFTEWTQAAYASPQPDSPGTTPLHADVQRSPTDSTGGVAQLLRTARAQSERLWPMLAQWTAYSEQDATATQTIVPRTTSNDGGFFEALLNSSQSALGSAAYNAALPGWSVSCGGYARLWASNNQLALHDRIAVIPVKVRVYGRTVTAGTGTFRFQTALHSYVDVNIPISSENAWHFGYGYLEVGITPEQEVIGQAMINHLGASGSLSIEAFTVYGSAMPGTDD